MADPAKQANLNAYVVIGMSIVLLFGAFNATMITADEYDPATLVWMYLGLDVVMTALLVVLLTQVGKSNEPGGLKTASMALGILGIVAGLIKIVARFSSDHGWWTGHFYYTL